MRAFDVLPNAEAVSGGILPVYLPQIVNHPLPSEVYEALRVGVDESFNDYLQTAPYLSRSMALRKWNATRDGLLALVRALRAERTTDALIYKEPFLSFAPRFMCEALQDARIIHIHRDGRDCADSLVRTYDVLTDEKLTTLRANEARLGRRWDHRYVPWWVEEGREDEFLATLPYVRAIWMWKTMVQRCHQAFSQLDPGRVLLVRYERLVQDPEPVGRAMADHLGLEVTPRFRGRLAEATTASIGIHLRRPADEIAVAKRVASAELKLYGYT
jgi:hypothetical protein